MVIFFQQLVPKQLIQQHYMLDSYEMRKLCSYDGLTPPSTSAGGLADLWKGVSL